MTMSPTIPEEQQHQAFEAYKAAKNKLDAEVTFENAKVARETWWRFLNLFEKNTAEPRSQ
jgi:hypothetical protein